jgi:hypothetical protein
MLEEGYPDALPDALTPRRGLHRHECPRGPLRRRPTVQPSYPDRDHNTFEFADQLDDPRTLRTRHMRMQKTRWGDHTRVVRSPQKRRDRFEIAILPRPDHNVP